MAVVGVLALQAIGGYAFGTIGTLVGGVIGNALFNKPPTIRNEGPRLENLKTIQSQYGANINHIFGMVRTAGSGVIWGIDAEEVKNTTTTRAGGKGTSQKVENTTWNYYGTFAILICHGKVDGIPRMWIDSDICFDFSTENLANAGGVCTMLEKDGEVYGQRVNLDSDKLKGEITFYFGTENQPVDPTIESIEGVGKYPAHKKYCYAVFNRIDLTKTGGRPPNFNFEVKRNGIAPTNKADFDLVDLSALNSDLTNAQILNYSLGTNGKSVVYNKDDNSIYAMLTDTNGNGILLNLNPSVNSGGDTSLKKYRRLKGYNYDYLDWNPNWINDPNVNDVDFDKTEYLTVKKINESSNYDMNFGAYLDFYENTLLASTQYVPAGLGNFPAPIYDVSGMGNQIIFLEGAYEQENESGISKSQISGTQTISVVTKANDKKEIQSMKLSNIDAIDEQTIHIFRNLPTQKNKGLVERYILKYLPQRSWYSCGFLDYNNANLRFYGNGKFHSVTVFRNDTTMMHEYYLSTPDNFMYFKFLEKPISENWNVRSVDYDIVTNCCFIAINSFGATGRPNLMIKIKLPGEIVSIKNIVDDENFKPWKDQGLSFNLSKICFNTTRACFLGAALVNMSGQTQGNIICTYNVDTEDFNFTEVTDYIDETWQGNYFLTNFNTFYNNRNSCLYQPFTNLIEIEGKVYLRLLKFYGKKFDFEGYSLINLIKEVCLFSGLKEEDLDFTELEDSNVRGYTVNAESTARGIIEHLAYVYNFGVVETGGKIKFKNNGNAPSLEFDTNELGVQNYGADIDFEDVLNTSRTDEKTLPETVNFTFSNINFQYENDTQEEKMIGTSSINIISNEIPIVLTEDEGKAVVKRVINTTWAGRDKFNFSINYDGIELEPLDVVTVNNNGFKHNIKITKLERQGGIIKIEGFSENATVYDQSNAVGGTSEQKPRPEIKNIAKTDLKILDIPLIDNNLINDAGFYMGAYPLSDDTWTGASIFSTYDSNIPYDQKLSFTKELNFGIVQNNINDFKDNIVDCTNYIDIELNNSFVLTSISEDQFFDGGNLCVINKEILQFKDVEVIGINKYRLTKLLRGRFGTEINTNNHQFGDTFIYLDTSLKNLSKNLTEINKMEFFKTVSFGDNSLSEYFTQYENKAIRLKCLAPFNLNYTRDVNGTLYLNWKNRARGIITSFDIIGDTYDEDGLTFKVYIYNKSQTQILRTIDISNKTECIYNYLDQINDFGSLQTSLYIEIYKVNKFGQVGFPLQTII